MKKSTQRNNSQIGYILQPKKLSFYEENYILEPVDITTDNYYLDYEGDLDSEVGYDVNYYLVYETVA